MHCFVALFHSHRWIYIVWRQRIHVQEKKWNQITAHVDIVAMESAEKSKHLFSVKDKSNAQPYVHALHTHVPFICGQPSMMNTPPHYQKVNSLSQTFSYWHLSATGQLSMKPAATSLFQLPSKAPGTWKKLLLNSSDLPNVVTDLPHLLVQRCSLIIVTLSLMGPSSRQQLSVHTIELEMQIKLLRWWEQNERTERRVCQEEKPAFCLKCHCPFLTEQRLVEGGGGASSKLSLHQKKVWKKIR